MATQEQVIEIATGERMTPPLPRWAYSIVNPTMKALLRSPMHRLLSHAMMILIFNGRKSGKRYTIPVGYLQEGNKLYLFSHANWAKNFIGGAPVAIRLRGELVRGTARVTHNPVLIDRFVQHMRQERGEAMAQRMGVLKQKPDGSWQTQMPEGTSFIEIELADEHA